MTDRRPKRVRVAEGIYRRNGAYEVKWWDSEAKKQRWICRIATFEDAKAIRADIQRQKLRTASGHRAVLVKDFAATWLDTYPRAAGTTNKNYRVQLPRILAEFADRRMGSITRPEARAFANTEPNAWKVARAMWGDAWRDGIDGLTQNPFAQLRIPVGPGRRNVEPLTETDIGRLCDAARRAHGEYGERYAAFIQFAAYTGLRIGELYGLQWHDIDQSKAEVNVRRQYRTSTSESAAPKNGEERVISLWSQAEAAMDIIVSEQRLYGVEGPWVFTTARGKQYTGRVHHYYWHPVRVAADMAGLDFHELRHFTGSFMADRGATAMMIADQLGHRDGGKLALELYVHTDRQRVHDRIRRLVSGPPVGATGT